MEGYTSAILTPNVVEFERLYEGVTSSKPNSDEAEKSVKDLCQRLGNVTIVSKGHKDIISDGNQGMSLR